MKSINYNKKSILAIILIISITYIMITYLYKSTSQIVAEVNVEIEHQPLDTVGTIPTWLNNITLVKNGSISVKINGRKTAHWFDNPAMLHGFLFQNGKVFYTNKFLKSKTYKKIFLDGNINVGGFATNDENYFFRKLKYFFSFNKIPDIVNASVNVDVIGNQYVALTEAPLPVQFDLKTLNTIGPLQYKDNLPMINVFESAHPQNDYRNREKINYLIKYGKQSEYIIYKLNDTELTRKVIIKIPVKTPSYMHSFAITTKYIILVEFPFILNPIDLMLKNKPYIKNFYWEPNRGVNFIIINRLTGKHEKTINHKIPFFAFHHVNAFDDEDKIILDIIVYPNAKIVSAVANAGQINLNENEITQINNNFISKLMRYKISITDEIIDSKVLLNSPTEFPKINEYFNANKHIYVYAVDPRLLNKESDLRAIYKINTATQDTISWAEAGSLPGEPIFIPKPSANGEEDDGAILSVVLNPFKKSTFLLVLDAKSFKEIARSYTPHLIPLGFHGQYFLNAPY